MFKKFKFSGLAFLIIGTNVVASLRLTSSSFTNNGTIPITYTGQGRDISPTLGWTNAPKNTKSFALIVDDPDAKGKAFVHWQVFNIPDTVQVLSEGADTSKFGVGVNDFNANKYRGPLPPKKELHHYHFTLYALDAKLSLPNGVSKEQLLAAMQGHILDQATLIGVYKRG